MTTKPIIDNKAELAKLIKQHTELSDSSFILHNNWWNIYRKDLCCATPTGQKVTKKK